MRKSKENRQSEIATKNSDKKALKNCKNCKKKYLKFDWKITQKLKSVLKSEENKVEFQTYQIQGSPRARAPSKKKKNSLEVSQDFTGKKVGIK